MLSTTEPPHAPGKKPENTIQCERSADTNPHQIQIDNFNQHISNIAFKAANLFIRGHANEGLCLKELANSLKEESDNFFAQNLEQQKQGYPTFRKKCEAMLGKANEEVKNHRGYQQFWINLLQTLSILGAILGAVQWCITGRYSLFQVKTNASNVLDATDRSLALIEPPLN